jgi:hypothetical protein
MVPHRNVQIVRAKDLLGCCHVLKNFPAFKLSLAIKIALPLQAQISI